MKPVSEARGRRRTMTHRSIQMDRVEFQTSQDPKRGVGAHFCCSQVHAMLAANKTIDRPETILEAQQVASQYLNANILEENNGLSH